MKNPLMKKKKTELLHYISILENKQKLQKLPISTFFC